MLPSSVPGMFRRVPRSAVSSSFSARIRRFLPGLWVLGHYQRGWLRGDLLAGVVVAAYLVPQVMAYAEVAGLPAVAGLWASLAPLAIYAVLGTSRQLSVGPESSTALMTAVAVGALVGTDTAGYANAAAALAVSVGVMCILGWLGRLGFLANLLSHPVLIGYMAGIAVLMIVSQLGKVTGIPISGDSVITQLQSFLTQLAEASWPTMILAASVLALLFGLHRLSPRSPGPLIGMLLAALLVAVLDLGQYGVAVVGEIPRGLPTPAVPNFSALDPATLIPAALSVAIVGYTDNVLTGRAFAARRGETIDSGQEFLALGVANVAAGLSHGFPVSSSGSRTVIGESMGSRSQLYSLAALATVLLTIFFLRPVLAAFPLAALGAVVIYAAVRLIDVGELRRIARFRRSELILAVTTIVAVLTLDVLYGIAVAVVLSILDLLRRIARPHDGILGYVPGLAGMHDIDDYPRARQVPGLVVYRYDSPLFFANADDFRRRALASVDAASTSVDWFLLNAEANIEVDLTAVDVLEDLRRVLTERGIVFAMARVKFDLREALAAGGFIDKVGEDRIFATLPTAIDAYVRYHRDRYGRLPDGFGEIPPDASGRAAEDTDSA